MAHTTNMPENAVQRFYRFQASIYDFTRWTILHGRSRAAAALGLRPDSQVLEVGCGTGLNFRYMMSYLDAAAGGRLVGADFSSDMLRVARRRVERAGWSNVELVEADATKLDLKREFDAILFGYSLATIRGWPPAIERAYAHLKPGGRMAVLEFGRFDLWGPPGTAMRWWLRRCHVDTSQPYIEKLREVCDELDVHHWAGGYNFLAVGRRR